MLEKFRDSGKFPAAYPWFQETHVKHLPVGEDITFCIRAGALGIPVHVDTSIKVGHEKPFIGGERQFLIQQAIRSVKRSDDPIFAVVPTIDATEFQIEGADGVLAIPNDDFNAELNLSAKWNAGLDWAEKQAREAGNDRWNVAILNDDIEVDPDFLARLANGLRSTDNAWIAYPNIHGIDIPEGTVVHTESNALAGQTMSGYAFMVKGESGLRADEQFRWWYGDSDLERQVREAGKKTVCVGGCHLRHLHPMESSRRPELLALARGDELRFAGKWDLDVKSLWLNQNPEFGS